MPTTENTSAKSAEEKIFIQKDARKSPPEGPGWHDTDKGNLFFYKDVDMDEGVWSCRDEYISEEFPKFWYYQSRQPDVREVSEQKDICLIEGCTDIAQISYRLCPKHLREAHDRGFDDSNK